MANATLDARQDGSYRRIEVITGKRRRRRWTPSEKAGIVADSFADGANISDVARRHGVARGLLTVWRRQVTAAAGTGALGFVPVRIAQATEPDEGLGAAKRSDADAASSAWAPRCGAIEIEMGGARIRVEPGVDAGTLSTVLSVLRGGR
jgi:transposase